MTPNTRGALLMMASMAAFTLNDMFVKLMGAALPLGQILFLRGAGTSAILVLMVWRFGAFDVGLSSKDWGIITVRSLAEVGAAYFFLTALINMPLANISSILQLLPLTVTLAGALFLGEHVGWRRMLAIAIGFTGMLFIVRPGTDGYNWFSVYAMISVGFVTLRDIVTRRLHPSVPSLFVTLMASLAVWGLSWVMMWNTQWTEMPAQSWAYLAGAIFFVACGYLLSVLVMRVGQVSFVALFRYSGLIWALALGWIVFGDIPQPMTWLGAAMIVASGIFTIQRNASRSAPPKRG